MRWLAAIHPGVYTVMLPLISYPYIVLVAVLRIFLAPESNCKKSASQCDRRLRQGRRRLHNSYLAVYLLGVCY